MLVAKEGIRLTLIPETIDGGLGIFHCDIAHCKLLVTDPHPELPPIEHNISHNPPAAILHSKTLMRRARIRAHVDYHIH